MEASHNPVLVIQLLTLSLNLNRDWYKYDSVDINIEVLDITAHKLFNLALDELGFTKEGTITVIDGEELKSSRDYIVRYLDSATANGDFTAERMYKDLLEIKKAEDQYGEDFDIEPWL